METNARLGSEATAPARKERCDAVQNRRKILAAARDLFAAQGTDATDMHAVALAAGVGQGTLYRHFANKGELCLALIRDDLDAFMARTDEVLARDDASPSPLGRLDALLIDQIGLTGQHLPLLATIEETIGPPGPRHGQNPFRPWLRGRIAGLLSAAFERGEIAGDVDTGYVAEALIAVLSPRFVRLMRRELGYSPQRIAEGTRRVFVDGLRSDAAQASDADEVSDRQTS